MRVRSMGRIGGAALALLGAVGGSAGAEKFPQAWRRTMTNSPNSNFPLARFATPLPGRIDEAARTLMLVRVLGQTCAGASADEAVLADYLGHSGLSAVSGQRLEEISARVSPLFATFDYETLAHLCAGIGYLYGPDGALVPGVMKPGLGEPTFAYDPKKPRLPVAPLAPPGAE